MINLTETFSKLNNALLQLLNGFSSELRSIHREDLQPPYKDAIESINSAKLIIDATENQNSEIIRICDELRSICKEYLEIGISFENKIPEINACLIKESDKFASLFTNIGIKDNKIMDTLTGNSLLINPIRLNIKTIEPTVGTVMTSISVANDYNELTNLMFEFFLYTVLTSEKHVKIKGQLKKSAVLITGIMGLAPVIGIPASLTNLFISIKDMFTTDVEKIQTRFDQLERLSNATKIWNSAMCSWQPILETQFSVMSQKLSAISVLFKSLSESYKYWESRLKNR